jgi:hypothetical protein
MSDETILGLFADVGDILDRLRAELSCITTSDTGNDPNADTEEMIDDLREDVREKLSKLTSAALPQPETLPTASIQPKKDFS